MADPAKTAADAAASIARALNKVKTAGAARVAIGEALKYLSRGYELIDKVGPADARAVGVVRYFTNFDPKREKLKLDSLRSGLEAQYHKLPTTPSFALNPATWDGIRSNIHRVIVEVAGYEGVVGGAPTFADRAEIIIQATVEAPATAAKAVGTAVGKTTKYVAETAGKAVGGVAGGLLSGLGIWSLVLIAVAAYVGYRVVLART